MIEPVAYMLSDFVGNDFTSLELPKNPNNPRGLYFKEQLQPRVKMTKEQHDYISQLIQQGKDLGATFTEFWEVYKFIGASKKIDRTFNNQEQAMQVWLHPETIKVVDE